MRRRGKTRADEVQAALRRQYVFSLRRTGASYEAIYQAAVRRFGPDLPRGYSRWRVHKDVTQELQQLRQELAADVEAVRAQELDRLDQLQLAIWPLAVGRPANLEQGTPAQPPDLDAQRQVLAILARRAKYLPGLEVPVKVAPTTPDGEAAYQPVSVSAPPEHFFTELAVLFQQLGPQHVNGNTGPFPAPDLDESPD